MTSKDVLELCRSHRECDLWRRLMSFHAQAGVTQTRFGRRLCVDVTVSCCFEICQ